MPARLLVLDDHPLVFQALTTTLQERDTTFRIEAGCTLAQGLERIASQPPDLVLLDLSLPDAAGLDALQRLLHVHRALRVAIFSAASEAVLMRRALELGACGFIPKGSSMALICSAIALMLDGGTYLPPQLIERTSAGRPDRGRGAHTSDATDLLTPRQADVLALLVDGASNKAIARCLDLTEGTVKIHVSAVLRRLGVRTRAEAVMAAVRCGLAAAAPMPNLAPEAASAQAHGGAIVVRDGTGWRLNDAAA